MGCGIWWRVICSAKVELRVLSVLLLSLPPLQVVPPRLFKCAVSPHISILKHKGFMGGRLVGNLLTKLTDDGTQGSSFAFLQLPTPYSLACPGIVWQTPGGQLYIYCMQKLLALTLAFRTPTRFFAKATHPYT